MKLLEVLAIVGLMLFGVIAGFGLAQQGFKGFKYFSGASSMTIISALA